MFTLTNIFTQTNLKLFQLVWEDVAGEQVLASVSIAVTFLNPDSISSLIQYLAWSTNFPGPFIIFLFRSTQE